MGNDAKLHPLYMAEILYERTDEEHCLTTNELIKIFSDEYGINAHRQILVTEIPLLRDFGMDIDCFKSRQNK